MNSPVVALFTFACLIAGALLGGVLRRWLPVEEDLSKEARDFVRLGAGLIGTMGALALGLLVNSARSSFDTINNGLVEGSASRINLDRILVQYGPEAKAARIQLKRAFQERIDHLWPENGDEEAGLEAEEKSTGMEGVVGLILNLAPQNDEETYLKARALKIFGEGMELRSSLIENAHSRPPGILLIVLILWFTVLFGMLGLLAPRNATLDIVVVACALSVAGGVFLVLDMSGPFDGLFKVSSATMENALSLLGRD